MSHKTSRTPAQSAAQKARTATNKERKLAKVAKEKEKMANDPKTTQRKVVRDTKRKEARAIFVAGGGKQGVNTRRNKPRRSDRTFKK